MPNTTGIDAVEGVVPATFLAEQLPGPLLLFDRTILFANRALERLSGFDNGELIGQSPSRLLESAGYLLEELIPGAHELRLIRKDGARVWVRIQATELFGGNHGLYAALLTDISRQKLMEGSLQMLEKAVDTTQIGITITDPRGTILHTNPAEAAMHGWEVDELLGRDVRVLAPEKLWNPLPIEELYQHQSRRRESVNVHRGGREFPVLLLSDLVTNPDGKPVAVVTTCLDMTEQRKADHHRRMLEKALQETQIGVTITDLEGKILYSNPAEAAMHGYEVEELIGRDVRMFGPPRLRRLMTQEELRFMQRRCRETTNLRKDGTEFPVRLLSDLVTDAAGEPIAVVATCEDITERRRSELDQEAVVRALEASATVSSLLLGTSNPSAVVPEVLETLGRAADASRCSWFENSRGLDGSLRTNLRGEWCAPGVAPGIDTPQLQEIELERYPRLIEVLGNNQHYKGIVRTLCIEERELLEPRGVRSILLLPLMVHGYWSGFIGFDDCVSERSWLPKEIYLLSASAHSFALAMERWQSQLHMSRLASAVEQAAEGLAVFDLDGRLQYANAAFSEMTSPTAVDKLGKLLQGPEAQEQATAQKDLLNRLAAGEVWRQVIESKQQDGSTRYDQITCSPLHDGNGSVVGFTALNTDITERMRLEQQLLLAQRMEAVGQLAGGIAHDFNNMVTAILGTANLVRLKIRGCDGTISEGIDTIERAAYRAAELTRGLLAFARRQPLERLDIDVNAMVNEVQPILRSLVSESIDLELRLCDELAVVNADRGQLEQVLMNLCLNAKDAMNGTGIITVSTEYVEIGEDFLSTRPWGSPGTYVLLSVADTGEGMDEETRTRVFEPFFTTKQPGRGTGLGLAVVYGVIKQHDGMIDVSSTLGGGTTFSIYLPAIAGEVVTPVRQRRLESVGGNETILIVEDEQNLRRMLERVLTELGYLTITAADGIEALQLLESTGAEIDLVLTDLIMPRMGGRELFEKGRELAPDAVFLFTSGYEEEAFRKGLTGAPHPPAFVAKPYDLRELIGRIRDLLDRESQA